MSLTRSLNQNLQTLFFSGAGILGIISLMPRTIGGMHGSLSPAEFLSLICLLGVVSLLLNIWSIRRTPMEQSLVRALASVVIVAALSTLYLTHSRHLPDGLSWSALMLALMTVQICRPVWPKMGARLK